jgi:uncharacterized protein
MALLFTWDPEKAKTNQAKHGVSFEEALSAFRDPLTRIFPDERHSIHEDRELLIGHTSGGQLLMVSFVERGATIRVISARFASNKERRDYEAATR